MTGVRTTRSAVLNRGEHLAIAVLSRLLPARFRDRQRGEWTGDLIALTDGGRGARRRYLLAAAWTLPALRAAAMRGGLGGPAGPEAVTAARGVTTALARVLLIGLGWPVVSYLVTVPTRYLMFDIPDRLAREGGQIDPEDLLPHGLALTVLSPLIDALTFGAYIAILGGPFLAGTLGLTGVVVGLTRRGQRRRFRLAVGLLGLAAAAVALAALFTAFLADTGFDVADRGYGIGVLGAVTVGLGLSGRGLTRRTRAGLVLIGLGATAILVLHHTTYGVAMHTWFVD